MAQFRVLIFLNPVEGREEEFHEWYENTHLDDVLRTAGMAAAQRFDLGASAGMAMPNSHLAIYETEGESAEEVMARLNGTRSEREMIDAIDASQVAIWVFSELGERHVMES